MILNRTLKRNAYVLHKKAYWSVVVQNMRYMMTKAPARTPRVSSLQITNKLPVVSLIIQFND